MTINASLLPEKPIDTSTAHQKALLIRKFEEADSPYTRKYGIPILQTTMIGDLRVHPEGEGNIGHIIMRDGKFYLYSTYEFDIRRAREAYADGTALFSTIVAAPTVQGLWWFDPGSRGHIGDHTMP